MAVRPEANAGGELQATFDAACRWLDRTYERLGERKKAAARAIRFDIEGILEGYQKELQETVLFGVGEIVQGVQQDLQTIVLRTWSATRLDTQQILFIPRDNALVWTNTETHRFADDNEQSYDLNLIGLGSGASGIGVVPLRDPIKEFRRELTPDENPEYWIEYGKKITEELGKKLGLEANTSSDSH
jgi:hypothetical protein